MGALHGLGAYYPDTRPLVEVCCKPNTSLLETHSRASRYIRAIENARVTFTGYEEQTGIGFCNVYCNLPESACSHYLIPMEKSIFIGSPYIRCVVPLSKV